jgi:hypothetical protein
MEGAVIMFFIHSGFMMTGLLLLTIGYAVARFTRSNPRWLQRHKGLQISGAVCLLLGLTAAYLMVARHNGPHFNRPHPYLASVGILLAALSLILGGLMFRWKSMTLKLKGLHRWIGRSTLAILWITALLGMKLAGIF